MPYAIRADSDKCYSVINTETRKVHAKCTTKAKAQAQMRLLYGIEQGLIPRKK